MKITIEQKESWIISRIGDEPDAEFPVIFKTNEAAFANHERIGQVFAHQPKSAYQNFSDRLIKWIKRFRLDNKQEMSPNSVPKSEEKYVQK